MSSLSGTAFSGDSVEVIARQVQFKSNCARKEKTEGDLQNYYDIQRCLTFVTENNYHRVWMGDLI